MKINLIIILFFSFLIACNEGLAPSEKEQKTSINGIVHYINGKNNWPPTDSCFAVRIVAFKNYPPQNIIQELTEENAYFTLNSLPLFVDSSDFSLEIKNAPVELKYIVAALQYTKDLTSQKVIGVWSLNENKFEPSSIVIERGKSYSININVDFSELPPQPF
ncbi:MAG TPA: hypothetical protein PKY56_01420 [Candidatus Kapabacteria bacterium]|nr:hypothetical protein [Candidatus Kapabacteria bacterium]HPO62233.1 hypothetical protein [Candidatus Kapabacteria bacterium]